MKEFQVEKKTQSETSIKVAVRLRPFRQSEQDEGSLSIINIDHRSKQCQLRNPSNGETKSFTFDYVYDSFVPMKNPNHASQEKIWNDIGPELLDACMSGFNYTLAATGQTGSGKSHTILGFGEIQENKGILPRACDSIFEQIQKYKDLNPNQNDDEEKHFSVKVSMLEIYNERIRDLFVSLSKQERGGLRIRDSPQTGAYVEGLKKISVENVNQIRKLLNFGAKNRTIAATNMNKTSSRAHTIFTISLVTTTINKMTMKASDKTSLINLVDLAGSERVGRTGAEGHRLTEGGHINKSLSALGNVINALASNATKKKAGIVPYRSSLLTHLLKPSLGGNAKTTILATISPSDLNYGETLSTLRFADRAKQIKNIAIVNEDPNDRLIRKLRDEMRLLRRQLKTASGLGLAEKQRIKAEMEDMYEKKLRREKAEWDKAQEEMEETLGSLGALQQSKQFSPDTPYLTNINEDFSLSGTLKLYLEIDSEIVVGSRKRGYKYDRIRAEETNQIVVGGMGVRQLHAQIKVVKKLSNDLSVSIAALDNSRTLLNGKTLTKNSGFTTLTNNDRIIFGHSSAFKLVIPNNADQRDILVDWEFVIKEINAETIRKIKEENKIRKEAIQKEKEDMEKRVKELETQLQRTHKALLEEGQNKEYMASTQKDLEDRLREQILETEKFKKKKEKETKDRSLVDRQLLQMLPFVHEANAICTEINKPISFHAKLINRALRENIVNESSDLCLELSTEVCVAVRRGKGYLERKTKEQEKTKSRRISLIHINESEIEDSTSQEFWSQSEFNSKFFIMREFYQTWLCNGKNIIGTEFEDPERDPFQKQKEDHLAGVARFHLEALYYLLDIKDRTPIVDVCTGKSWGELSVTIMPYIINNSDDIEMSYEVDKMNKVMGKNINISVNIHEARGLPLHSMKEYNSIFLRWRFQNEKYYTTKLIPIHDENPVISHKETLKFPINEKLISFLQQGAVAFEVWISASVPIRTDDLEDEEYKSPNHNATKERGLLSSKSNKEETYEDILQENKFLRVEIKKVSEKLAEAMHQIDVLKKLVPEV